MKFLSGFPKKEVPSEILDDKSLLPETTQASTETRKGTDKHFVFVFVAFALVTIPFVIYTLHYSNINRLSETDDCGNICGQKNTFDPDIPCSGKDYTDKPFSTYFECEVTPSSLKHSYLEGIHKQLSHLSSILLMASFVPIVLTLLLAVGFRYAPFVTVVGILGISWAYLVVASLIFCGWYFLSSYTIMFFIILFPVLAVPIIFPVLAVIMLCVMIHATDRIVTSITLFKEAAKAISNIEKGVLISIMTLLIAITLVVVSGIIHLHMSTAGILQNTRYDRMEYVENGLMTTGIVLNVVLTAWIVKVMLELQNMTLSNAVSKWYSSRSPVTTYYHTMLKNHLGSAFLGSMVPNFLSVPQSILIFFSQFSITKGMADAFLRCLNGFHYSYIFTASQGSSYFESSKKARQLLNLKVGDATGVRPLGSFVMFLCQILVTWVSIVFYFVVLDDGKLHYNYNYNYPALCCSFVAIVSFLSCCTLLAPIQVAYDTLFMRACEDNLKEGHPVYSKTIKEFHSDAAEILKNKVRGNNQQTTTLDAVV